jgi:hypothetical protein
MFDGRFNMRGAVAEACKELMRLQCTEQQRTALQEATVMSGTSVWKAVWYQLHAHARKLKTSDESVPTSVQSDALAQVAYEADNLSRILAGFESRCNDYLGHLAGIQLTVSPPDDCITASQLQQWNVQKGAASRQMQGITTQLQATGCKMLYLLCAWRVTVVVGVPGGGSSSSWWG